MPSLMYAFLSVPWEENEDRLQLNIKMNYYISISEYSELIKKWILLFNPQKGMKKEVRTSIYIFHNLYYLQIIYKNVIFRN